MNRIGLIMVAFGVLLFPRLTTGAVSDFTSVSPVAAVNVLQIGVEARVINDDPASDTITLIVRDAPGRDASVVTRLHEGDHVTLVDGPREADDLRWWQIETPDGTRGWTMEGLNNTRTQVYERTLLPLCPAEGERLAYRVADYIVTSGIDGADPCVLDHLAISDVFTFWGYFFYFPNTFLPSPDGKYFLYMDGSGSSDLYRLSRDGGERLKLTRNGRVNWAAWSPDGTYIAVSNLPQIWIMNADGTSPFALTEGNVTKPWVTWLPDSQTLVYIEQNAHGQMHEESESVFYSVNMREGNLREILRTTLDVRDAEISPDGRLLAVVGWIWSDDGEPTDNVTWVINLESGEKVLDSDVAYENILWTPDSRKLVFLRGTKQLDVLPLDASQLQTFSLDFKNLPDKFHFIRWDSDDAFLVMGTDDVTWSVNITTQTVARYVK